MASVPPPPADPEKKKIIDKLAQFVARNGPQFENMTKQKQANNPQFEFLFGGPEYNYYQYRVTTEQIILKQQTARGAASADPDLATKLAQLEALKEELQSKTLSVADQIKQSEQNLSAHEKNISMRQQTDIEEGIVALRVKRLKEAATECEIDIGELETVLLPLRTSCTKDAIQNAKYWVLTSITNSSASEFFSQFLINRVFESDTAFESRLHLCYLLNDIMHHCARKPTDYLKRCVENVVSPIFCIASLQASEEQKPKLQKLLTIWEQHKYFIPAVLEGLQNPQETYARYQADLVTKYADVVTQVTSAGQEKLNGLEKQHLEFAAHLNNELKSLQKRYELEKQNANNPPPTASLPPPAFNQPPPSFEQLPPADDFSAPPPGFDTSQPPPGAQLNVPPPNLSAPPPGMAPDLSGPPPNADMIPSAPYYRLPAGLLVTLVKTEDFDYRSIDPDDIRLPPPKPPSEKLLAAIEAFYQPPSHECPVDQEGWESMGLYEYYKIKNEMRKEVEAQKALKRKEERRFKEVKPDRPPQKPGLRRSRSRSPPTPRRSRSRSVSREKEPSRSRSPDRREYKRSSRSRTRSPVRRRSRTPVRRRSRSPVRQRSRTPVRRKRSRTPSPRMYSRRSYSRSKSRSRSRSSSRSRSRSRTPRRISRAERRSPTPDDMPVLGMYTPRNMEAPLGLENKGAQLLKKMGWGGAGLGAAEQGIVDPVKAAEVRTQTDMYRGIGAGVQDDPFEQFRKNRGSVFIQKLKDRDEKLQEQRRKNEAGITREKDKH